MRVLHILNDGPVRLPDEIIREQSKVSEVKVIDLSKRETSYESVVDYIFSYDRVISW
ncbi:MAG: hypothetical protein M1510_13430 [Nitrospirae bacterium]|nr:hypothetical protein [Nitrospirota bacterium]MCL5237847.1 hypothetical protein [Nitrospirota bacterium]